MTLTQIIERLRWRLDDRADPPLWSADELTDFVNEAEEELCEKCFLIEDATKSISVTGSSNISFTQTGSKITKASGFGDFSKVTTFTITGTTLNNGTFTVVSATDTVIVTSEALSDESNQSAVLTATHHLTMIPISQSTPTIDTDSRIVRIQRAKLSDQTTPLTILRDGGVAMLDSRYTDWEDLDDSVPKYLLTNGVGEDKARLFYSPEDADTLYLTVYRRPMRELVTARLTESPEISAKYHKKLDDFVLHKCYGKPDVDTFDKKKSQDHLALWILTIEEITRGKLHENRGEEIASPHFGAI